jgi:regulator of protease activity HflC (stomatin/prohibitin superfamily)
VSSYDSKAGPATLGAVAIAALSAVITIIGLLTGVTTTDGGQVGVVRNGGVLDNRNVRGVVDPASGVSWAGFWSDVHKYPAQQRFYTVTADGKRGERTGVDVVAVPSADGVQMGIEGTVYFTLTRDHKTLAAFDDRYGTRSYTGLDKENRHAWDGDDGWNSFLDQIIRPVIESDLRQQMARWRCADLISSCALVQNATGTPASKIKPGGAIQEVQRDVNTSLAESIKTVLGGDYLTNVSFNLTKVTLPGGVQDAVNSAQAAYADVSKSQAKVQQAKAEADANRVKQDGYNKCPMCARIDLMKAIPPSVTTYAPGNDVAVTPGK